MLTHYGVNAARKRHGQENAHYKRLCCAFSCPCVLRGHYIYTVINQYQLARHSVLLRLMLTTLSFMYDRTCSRRNELNED